MGPLCLFCFTDLVAGLLVEGLGSCLVLVLPCVAVLYCTILVADVLQHVSYCPEDAVLRSNILFMSFLLPGRLGLAWLCLWGILPSVFDLDLLLHFTLLGLSSWVCGGTFLLPDFHVCLCLVSW